jgi:hypothetical protein
MPGDSFLPPMNESSFKKRFFLSWLAIGSASTVGGLILGPRMNHSHNPWLCVVIALSVLSFSFLLCRIVLMWLWRNPAVVPTVLYFSVPVGGVALAVVFIMRAVGPGSLFIEPRALVGLTLSMGLLYAAALIWGIGVGVRRKKLGNFKVERRP